MSTYAEIRIVNLQRDETYQRLLEFIRKPEIKKRFRIRLVDSKEPSYIKIKMGPLSSLDVRILPQNGRSRMEFNFDFSPFLSLIIFSIAVLLLVGLSRPGYMYIYLLAIIPLIQYCPKETVKNFMERLDSFFIQLPTEVTLGFKVEEAEERRPLGVDALYERLIEACSVIHCSERRHAKQYIEHKLKSYLKKGLNREEAIIKLAEKEGLLERAEREVILKWAEAKPKPKPQLPPETLYQRLLYKYSVYGRSISALEYRIEEYMKGGLSREEAIGRLAEEEGIA